MDPGFIFAPADHVLTDKYLAEKIAGRPVASPYIDHADVYSALPEDLVSGRRSVRDRDGNDACFLYTAVRFATKNKTGYKLRRIDDDPRKSYWHSEKGKIPLKGSKIGGYVQDFVHAIKDTHNRIERLGWRMKEYGLSTEQGDSDIVICKLYHTPRRPSTASSSTTSSASSVEEDVPVCSHPAINSKKRKATVDGDYPQASALPSARPRLSHANPMTTTDPEPEAAEDEQFQIYYQVLQDDSFFQSVQQELPSLYPDNKNVAVTTPWAPVTEPTLYARFSQEGAHQEPDEPIYRGLPCPAFSPEMISSCSDEWPSLVTFIDANDLY